MKIGQIDLFSKRVRKPPVVPEMALHGMVADTLAIGLAPGWLWWHTPSGGWRTPAEAGKFKRMGAKAGVSDILLIGPPHATLCALELKRKGGKPTEEQTAFLRAVRAAGGHATWCDSYDQALVILKLWGAVSDRVRVSV